MKLFLEKLKIEIFIVLGLLLILTTIYFRVLLKKLPKDLYFYQNFGLNFSIMYITLISISISLIIIISCIRIIYDIKLKKNIKVK